MKDGWMDGRFSNPRQGHQTYDRMRGVFVMSKNDKGLISRIYKELLQSYKKKTGNNRNTVKGCE